MAPLPELEDDPLVSSSDLEEPLLSASSSEQQNNSNCDNKADVAASAAPGGAGGDDDAAAVSGDPSGTSPTEPFTIKAELWDMANLALPLAVSFFCRMGMASTDSAFVGHIHDDNHTPETYLAAAVLSDMVLNVCITPPLAFNQVLNSLVGQAMGSGNREMAGVWLQLSMFWLAVSMLPCLLGLLYVRQILTFLGFPLDIAEVAGVYAKYNMIWPIPNGLYQCMRFYFQARGLPRPAMYNNMIFLGVNAFLNWTFVFGGPFKSLGFTGFGFIGAAISLSISRTMQGVTYYLYMFAYKQHHKDAWPEAGWSFANHTKDRTLEFMKQSLPNIGTLLFQAFASQATTVLVGRLGELPIAASSALSTVTIPFSGTMSATCTTVSGVRVGYHLGRGDPHAAKKSSWIVLHFITIMCVLFSVLFMIPYMRHVVLDVATDDEDVMGMATTLVPAMLVGTYLNLIVGNITSGVFSGQGRPVIATILSFGFEMPLSIGGVAILILFLHSNLLGVYWYNAASGAVEAVIVLYLMVISNWTKCADDARARQEAARVEASGDSAHSTEDEAAASLLENAEDGAATTASTDVESSSQT